MRVLDRSGLIEEIAGAEVAGAGRLVGVPRGEAGRVPQPPLPDVPGVEHRFVTVGDLRFHVAEAGTGDPLVLVHGWPQHWWMWRDVIPQLAETHRVICPDLRGHGWSDAPGRGYEKEQLATDLLGIMDALGLAKVSYAGHDWGGFAGFLLALRAPERIARFVALGIPHMWPTRSERLDPRRLIMFGYQAPLSTPFVGEALMRAGGARRILTVARASGRWSEPELRAYDDVMRQPERARATVRLYRTFILRELPAIAAGRYARAYLRVPTHQIVGSKDIVGRFSSPEGAEGHADDLTVETVPGCGHFIVDEAPDLVAERIRAAL